MLFDLSTLLFLMLVQCAVPDPYNCKQHSRERQVLIRDKLSFGVRVSMTSSPLLILVVLALPVDKSGCIHRHAKNKQDLVADNTLDHHNQNNRNATMELPKLVLINHA